MLFCTVLDDKKQGVGESGLFNMHVSEFTMVHARISKCPNPVGVQRTSL